MCLPFQEAPCETVLSRMLIYKYTAGIFREGDEIKAVFSPKLVLSHHVFTWGFF